MEKTKPLEIQLMQKDIVLPKFQEPCRTFLYDVINEFGTEIRMSINTGYEYDHNFPINAEYVKKHKIEPTKLEGRIYWMRGDPVIKGGILVRFKDGEIEKGIINCVTKDTSPIKKEECLERLFNKWDETKNPLKDYDFLGKDILKQIFERAELMLIKEKYFTELVGYLDKQE